MNDAAPPRAVDEASPVGRWLRERERWVLLGLFLLALIVRLACFGELARGPCASQHKWQDTDMRVFDEWARGIAGGDVLSRNMRPPYNTWQRAVADAYFQQYPEKRARFVGGVEDPGRALWDQWYGEKVLYQEPLYPYLVAMIYKAFSPDPRWVMAVQLLLGSLGCVLCYLATRAAFGVVTATVAGALLALCGPVVFYEMTLLRETVLILVGWGMVLLSQRAFRSGRALDWFLAGLAAGVGLLVKSVFVFFVAGLVGTAAARLLRRPRDAARWRPLACLVAGVALCLGPIVVRNVVVGAPALAAPSGGSFALIVANFGGCNPETGPAVDAPLTARIVEQAEGRMVPTLLATLRTHDSVASYALLLFRKFSVLCRWYEMPNNANFYYYRIHSRVLRWLPVTFFLVAPLAIAGLIFCLRRPAAAWPLYLLCLTHVIPLMVFQPLSRYRIPLVAALVPFAACAVVLIATDFRRRQVRQGLLTLAAVLLTLAWTARPLRPGTDPIRPVDRLAPFNFHYLPVLDQAARAGDWGEAARVVEEYLGSAPAEVAEMGVSRPALTDGEARVAQGFAKVYAIYADVLQRGGRVGEVARQEERAEALTEASREFFAR